MITDPFVFKVLDISTGHITKEDGAGLTANEHGPAPVYELQDYGWLIYVGEIEENWPKEDDWSDAFRKIVHIAKELGCDYVRFDRDGREYPELQKFDW